MHRVAKRGRTKMNIKKMAIRGYDFFNSFFYNNLLTVFEQSKNAHSVPSLSGVLDTHKSLFSKEPGGTTLSYAQMRFKIQDSRWFID